MTKRIGTIILLSTLILSACSLQQEQLPQYKVIYKILPNPDTVNANLDEIKPILEKRLEKLNLEESSITKEGNTLVANIRTTSLATNKASSLTNPFDLTLQESRTEFTAEEKKANEDYNAKQKQIALEAQQKATEKPDTMDSLVAEYSEKMNLMNKGIQGPYAEGKVDAKQWPKLAATDEGKITEVVEDTNNFWFAKVLEKKTVKTAVGDQMLIRYQEIVRFTKDTDQPRLDHVPVASFGKFIEKVLVEKIDPNSKRNKNYLVSVYLNDEGKKELERVSEQYKTKELTFFVDRVPYATVTFSGKDSSGILKIDDAYNEREAEEIVAQLNMPWLPAPLTVISFEKLE